MPKLKLSNPSAKKYARALRGIGRDIADRFPDDLEIEVIGATYKARYHARTNTAQANKDIKVGVLQKLFNRSQNQSTKLGSSHSTLVPEVRIYTPESIDAIYDSQIASRKSTGGNPDIHNLAERLRTIGRVVELTQGKLIRVTKNAHSISFQYSDSSGQVHTEELTNQNVFRLQQEYNSKRQNQNDEWKRDAR